MVKSKKIFCCEIMEGHAVSGKEIDYESSTRDYSLILSDDEYGTRQTILYCPWCGTKLPKSLDEEWGEVLEKEYNLEDPGLEDADKVPEEFKTDEWWRKRGL